MPRHLPMFLSLFGVSLIVWAPTASRAGEIALPDSTVIMRVLIAELARSMEGLELDDLPRPYFIQYKARDQISYSIGASNGAVHRANNSRRRTISTRVRVGSYELDNTNTGGGGGGRGTLPIDDDETALRHALWRVTDRDYKRAVEILSRKEAFLKEKNVEDRPDDYSPASPMQLVEAPAKIRFDQQQWRDNVGRLAQRLKKYSDIQDSGVSFTVAAVNEWIVNTEGTRLRTGDTGVFVTLSARLQADDGMPLADSRVFIGERCDQLPSVEKMLAEADDLCKSLIGLRDAPILEEYTGPVLFDASASGAVFESLFANAICARPIPLGAGARGDDSFEKKLGRRVLPRSFNAYDDPQTKIYEGEVLAGAYKFDDEAVIATRVDVVEKGIIRNMLASRAPTKKIKQTNGHGRSSTFGDARARVGCLYIEDSAGIEEAQLKQKLIELAMDEGLEFGLRISALRRSGFSGLGDPLFAYKVYVDDGREELVRGLKFAPVPKRSLKWIVAGGRRREVHNVTSPVSSSIISPAILFNELELIKTEKEFDKVPILQSPAQRAG